MARSYKHLLKEYGIEQPSFTEGISRILDIGGTLSPTVPTKKKKNKDTVTVAWEKVNRYLDI